MLTAVLCILFFLGNMTGKCNVMLHHDCLFTIVVLGPLVDVFLFKLVGAVDATYIKWSICVHMVSHFEIVTVIAFLLCSRSKS